MSETWTIRRLITWTSGHLEKHEIDAPRLTAEMLLAHVLGVDRVRLYVDLDRPLNKDELATFRGLVIRRTAGEPTQYLTGTRDFYGRTFKVDPRVLIPRPETELLVEAALRVLPKEAPSRVLDLCTGSGCIGATIAAERPQAEVWGTDLSPEAAAVARANAEGLGVAARFHVLEGDLFAPVPADLRFDVVVSNPPYIREDEWETLQREVKREPRSALLAGPEGMDLLGRLVRAAPSHLVPGGLCAVEMGETQGAAVKSLFEEAGFVDVCVEKDLARLDRLVFGYFGHRAAAPLPHGAAD